MRWTKEFASLHGLDADLLGGTVDVLEARVHPDHRARLRAALEDSPHGIHVQYRLDGSEQCWLELRAQPISESDSSALVAGTCIDVTSSARRYADEYRSRLEAEAALRRMQGLQTFTAALGEAARTADVIDVVVREVLVVLGAEAAAVYRLRDDGATFDLLGSVGYPEELHGEWSSFSADTPAPASAAVAANALVVVESPEELVRRWPSLADARKVAGDAASVCAPLEIEGRVDGVLYVAFRSPRRFDEDDLATVTTIAEECSHALERARLYEAQRDARADALRLARRLRALQSVIDATLESQSLDELLRELLERLREALGTDTASFFVFDEERNDLVARAAAGLEVEVTEGVRVPVGQGFAGRIAAQREPWVVEDVSTIEIYSPFLRQHGLGSLAGVPLIADERLVGVLDVGTFERRDFSEDDLLLLRLVASRAALAVEQAVLHERHRTVAETLQRSLLPERLPEPPEYALGARYVPGGAGLEVGGDWYDAIAFGDGRLGIVVGDVVGRGIVAAAAMGQLRNALRAYAFEGLGPAAILGRLNQLALEIDAQDLFATAVLMVLDPCRNELRMSSAGHPPPLLVLPDAPASYLEGGRSLPLGASRATSYEDAVARFPPGALLLSFTDGLVERRDMSIEQGLERLQKAVSGVPHDLEALLDHLLAEFSAGEHGDDVAIVAVSSLERPVEPIRLRHAALPSSLAQVRGALREWLNRAHASDEEVYEIAVACNEACTNAIEHPLRSPDSAFFEVEGTCAGGVVTLVIRDFGRWREPRDDGDRGRGLKFIHALMDSVDVTATEEGTEIRMRRTLGGPA